MSSECLYEDRSGRTSQCAYERVLGFDFCRNHLDTPRGLQHMADRVRRGHVVLQSDVDKAITSVRNVQAQDYQTSALEKMNDALDRVLDFEDEVARLLRSLKPTEWRYKDRHDSEQLHSYVSLFERAQDRTTRVLAQVSKMAIQEKLTSLGKAQTELIIRIIMGVITDLELDSETYDRARQLLIQRLDREANLPPRVYDIVQKQLTTVDGEVVS